MVATVAFCVENWIFLPRLLPHAIFFYELENACYKWIFRYQINLLVMEMYITVSF